ncbi:hypothetical protein WJX73_006481 [Symbiochloris irregularis]|uniref:Uncharacterized protein n=1 Tax=Symbiochloris irregularis TaxID=706552 RepID=A0AAW1PMJ6_9CHLO
MVAFFVMTGVLAASSLVPALEGQKTKSSNWQIAAGYYAKRAWRILPAYLTSLAVALSILLWLKSNIGSLKHPHAREVARYVTSADPRSVWVDLTLSLNIFRRLGLVSYQWNLASQAQFYAVVPLVLIALKPGSKSGYRSRVLHAAVLTIVLSIAFRAFVAWKYQLTVPFSLYALDHFNVGGSSGHDPRHVRMNGHFFYDLHATLPGRANEFALGVVVYLLSSNFHTHASFKKHSVACTIGSVVLLALNGLACFSGAKAYEANAYPSAPPGVCYFVHIFIIGVFNPLCVAWLILYVLAQPDALSSLFARLLSVQPLKFMADISLSFWMLNWQDKVLAQLVSSLRGKSAALGTKKAA